MDENAKRLARHGRELRQRIARGEYGALPVAVSKPAPAKPAATRQAPVNPQMSETERQSRAHWTKKLNEHSEILALCRRYNAPINLALEYSERGLSPGEAEIELAKLAVVQGWSVALAEARGPMH